MTLGESHFQCILVFPVQPFQSILILIFIFFPFWQRIYRCRFSNPNCQISFRESCGKLNHLLVSWFLDNYLSSTEFCVYMFLCVWVCVLCCGGGAEVMQFGDISSFIYITMVCTMWVPCFIYATNVDVGTMFDDD